MLDLQLGESYSRYFAEQANTVCDSVAGDGDSEMIAGNKWLRFAEIRVGLLGAKQRQLVAVMER